MLGLLVKIESCVNVSEDDIQYMCLEHLTCLRLFLLGVIERGFRQIEIKQAEGREPSMPGILERGFRQIEIKQAEGREPSMPGVLERGFRQIEIKQAEGRVLHAWVHSCTVQGAGGGIDSLTRINDR
jgi:hypothetical protein